MMMSNVDLSEEQLSEYRETFSLFDHNGDGSIVLENIGDLLRALGKNPTEFQISQIKTSFLEKDQKQLNFDQVLSLLNQHEELKTLGTLEEFKQGFQVFDKDSTGFISSGELRYVLTSLGEKLNPSEVNELFKHTDIIKDGQVNYEEFSKKIRES